MGFKRQWWNSAQLEDSLCGAPRNIMKVVQNLHERRSIHIRHAAAICPVESECIVVERCAFRKTARQGRIPNTVDFFV